MTRFSASTDNEAVVPADRRDIWAVLTDPDALTELTPMLERIDAHGDLWTWHLKRISALGVGITPTFTERMSFDEGRRIDYVHDPAPGANERTGASGCYEMTDHEGGTSLKISLTLDVDLPLPRAAAPAVQRVMTRMMRRTGDEFSANLFARLGIADKYERVEV
jgi:carbon monoxide dehydrogenase subunit G